MEQEPIEFDKTFAEKMVRFGEMLGIDHHAQGPAISALIGGVLVFRSPWMFVAMIGYLVMHFCHGGSGTFQKPIRLGLTPGWIDIVIVTVGTFGLAAYVALTVYHVFDWTAVIIEKRL